MAHAIRHSWLRAAAAVAAVVVLVAMPTDSRFAAAQASPPGEVAPGTARAAEVPADARMEEPAQAPRANRAAHGQPRALDAEGGAPPLPADVRARVQDADEVVARRGHFASHYRNGWTADGGERVVAILTPTPQHYHDPATGRMERIDAQISASGEPGVAYASTTNLVTARFPQLGSGAGVRIGVEGHPDVLHAWQAPALLHVDGATGETLAGQPLDLVAPRPIGEGGRTLEYAGAAGDLAVRFRVAPGRLKHDTRLEMLPVFVDPRVGGAVAVRETVELAAGYTLVADGAPVAGEVVETHAPLAVTDAEGALVLRIGAPLVHDAAGAVADSGRYRITPLGDGAYEFALAVDVAWLAEPERAWPVTLDPTVTSWVTDDTFITEADPNGNFSSLDYLSVRASTTGQRARTLLKFMDVTSANIPAPVDAASFHAYCFSVPAGSSTYPVRLFEIISDWQYHTVTWNNFTGLNSPNDLTIADEFVTATGWHTWVDARLTSLVEYWRTNATGRARGLAMSYPSNLTHDSHTLFRSLNYSTAGFEPYLSVSYTVASGVDLVDAGEAYRAFSPRLRRPGQSLTIQAAIRNSGNQPSGAFDVAFYASPDSNITTADHLLAVVRVNPMSAGEVRTLTISGTVPLDAPNGYYRVGWLIDANDEVAELDETNNVAYKINYLLRIDEITVVCGGLADGGAGAVGVTGLLLAAMLLGLVWLRRSARAVPPAT